MRDAHNWLDAALNPERREKLAPSQVLLLLKWGREKNCHVLMDYIAADVGYSATPKDPEDERARQQREFCEAVAALERLGPQLLQGMSANLLKRVA
jgi:hypothetical protein